MTNTNDAPQTPNNQPAPGKLVLVRHTESEWNLLGKWTGRTDVHITDNGKLQAEKIGQLLRDIEFQHSYSSQQMRTFETFLGLIEQSGNSKDMPHERVEALNERDYGEYTGMNKWEVLEQLGEDTFTGIRRGWDHPVPKGETLKMVHERAVPYYQKNIVPRLLAGQNVLIVSHGNTLRALIKHLEDIDDAGIAEVEMGFGQIIIYDVNKDGKKHTKEIRQADIKPPNA